MSTIDISTLNKGAVLAALYNASRPLGMGFMQYDPTPMTAEQGADLLKCGTYFDYLKGRVMKSDLSKDEFDTWGYDRDNGQGAAKAAIDALRTGNENAPEIVMAHEQGKQSAAETVRKHLSTPTKFGEGIVTLGLADVADKLGPKVNEAIEHRNQ